jgi:hypothetical protein
MTVADARQFAASRGARRSGIAAPLWHIWLPAAPLRQVASSYTHACNSIRDASVLTEFIKHYTSKTLRFSDFN